MFKKLQNLLFEDEDDDIVNEQPQVVSQNTQQMPAQPAPVRPVEPQQQAAPAAVRPSAPAAPVQQAAPAAPVQQPVAAPAAPVQPVIQKVEEVKRPTLGLTVDDAPVEKKKTVKPAAVKPAVPVKKEKVEDATNYQFRPVISPIFGVDEKDVTALKNTTSRFKDAKKKAKEQNTTPVLSPMYGIANEDAAAPSVDEEDATTDLLSQINANANTGKEDDIPEFSLDDILKVRDEEFADEDRAVKEDSAPMFPDLTFDDDDDAPAEAEPVENEEIPADMPANMPSDPVDDSIDNTVVIKQQLFDDDEN